MQISSSLFLILSLCYHLTENISTPLVYVPSSSETISGSHGLSWSSPVQVQLFLCLPARVFKPTVFPLQGLPDPPVTFDWAQFRFGVRGQRAPGCLGAKSHSWARGSLCGAHVACNPEGPYAAVHPRFKGLTHQLGFTLGLLHGRLLERQLQHGAQLLEALLQVQVTRRACVEPAVLLWSGDLDLHTKKIGN